MKSLLRAALAAGAFGALLFPVASVAEMDMSGPVPWSTTGATPYVQRDAQQKPIAVGLTIPAKTIAALPAVRSEAVYPVDRAGLVQTVNLQWHPHGHEPEHVYDVPHFDLHFYTITEKTRATIVPNAPAGTVMPPKSMLPPDGILAPGFVPGMGMHDVPAAQPEFNHGTFAISPILGFWNGDVAFFEVMFTKAWIDGKHDTTGTMPTPATVATHGLYPTRYAVHYDKAADAYRVEIGGFVQR